MFLCAMNEGIFPSRKTSTTPGHGGGAPAGFRGHDQGGKGPLSLPRRRGGTSTGSPRYPSRFLLDIDPGLLAYTEKPRDGLIAEARDYIAMSGRCLGETPPGRSFPRTAVKHSIFGLGTVVDADRSKGRISSSLTTCPHPAPSPSGRGWRRRRSTIKVRPA